MSELDNITENTEEVSTSSKEDVAMPVEDIQMQPVWDDRHLSSNPLSGMTKRQLNDATKKVIFPTDSFATMLEQIGIINNIPTEELEKFLSDEEKIALGVYVRSGVYTEHDNMFFDTLDSDVSKYVNVLNYGDKKLISKPLKPSKSVGEVSGNTGVAVFTSIMGLGEVIQFPLWNSGIWITIKPPKSDRLISLQSAIASNQIRLGRDTSTLVYSNYGVVVNRLLVDFIMEHFVSTSVKLPEDKTLLDIISVFDLQPLALCVIAALHPDGFKLDIPCKNTKIEKGNNKPKCSYIATGIVDPYKLLWVDRTYTADKFVIEHMANRAPGSMTYNQVVEYQQRLQEKKATKFDVMNQNDVSIEFTLTAPSLKEYLRLGEAWVQSVIGRLSNIFTGNESQEQRNEMINKVAETVSLGVYNTFITEIRSGDTIVRDKPTLNEIIEQMTNDDSIFAGLSSKIRDFITKGPVAYVACADFSCPTCRRKSQMSDNSDDDCYTSLIPLNIIELFFDLSILRVEKILGRQKITY